MKIESIVLIFGADLHLSTLGKGVFILPGTNHLCSHISCDTSYVI